MDWMQELVSGIKEAAGKNEKFVLAVHSEAQAELGRRAAQRLGAANIEFIIIPEEGFDYPVGISFPG